MHLYDVCITLVDMTTLSVRLDEETRRLIDRLARARRLSRSELVRRGIRLLAEHDPHTQEANPYASIRHLVGRVRGGPPDLSEQTGARFRKILADRKP
jgi:Arc/MetJ-type ribon-helix-helix transcriptional regulator